jgi:hypothetical protein
MSGVLPAVTPTSPRGLPLPTIVSRDYDYQLDVSILAALQFLLTLGEGVKLPSTVLDDLGSIRVRNAVQKWPSFQINSAR